MNHYPMSYANRRQHSPSRRNKFVSDFKIHKFQVFGDSLAVMLWQGANINNREVQESDYIRGCDSSCYSDNLFSHLVRTEGQVPPQIILAIGYNESISTNFNPKKLFYHIEYIINQMKKRGCQDLVLMNIPPSPCINTRARQLHMLGVNPNLEVLRYWRNLQEINKKIQDLAVQQKNVHVCDVFNKFCYPIWGDRSDDYVIENQVRYVVEMHKFVCFKPNERPRKGEQHLITFTREGKAVLFEHVQNTLNDLEYYIFLENDKKRKKELLQTKQSKTRREDCFTQISSEENDEEDGKSNKEKKNDNSNNVTDDAKASKSRSPSVCIINSPSKISPNRSRASPTISSRRKSTSEGDQCSPRKSRSRRRSTFRNLSPPARSSCRNPSPRRRHPSRSRTSSTPLYRKSRSKSRVHSRASSSNMKSTVGNHSPSSGYSSYPLRYSPSAHSRSRSPPFRLSKSQSSHFRRSQSRSPLSRQSRSQSPLFIRSQSLSREERSASYLEYNVPPSQSPLNDGEGSEECPSSNLSHTSDIVCVEDDDDQLYNPVSDDLNESGNEHEGDNVPPPTDSNAPSTSTSTGQARGLPLIVCNNTCTCPKCIYNIAEFTAGFSEAVDELCSKYGF